MEKIKMLILAKSYKPGGRCIAGKRVEFVDRNTVEVGDWIRPVPNSGDYTSALTRQMYMTTEGKEAQLLDIVEIPIVKHTPIPGQPENYAIDANVRWRKLDTFDPNSVQNIIDTPRNIWNEPGSKSDCTTQNYEQTGPINESLYLIKPKQLNVILSYDYNPFKGKHVKKAEANFLYKGETYRNLHITHDEVGHLLKSRYPKKDEQAVTIELIDQNYIICVSLSARFKQNQNKHYKVVATIFNDKGPI